MPDLPIANEPAAARRGYPIDAQTVPFAVDEPGASADWLGEPPFSGYRQQYRVLRRLHAEQTPWQYLEIVETEPYGRMLLLDGACQTSIGDEFTYHEYLVHVPLFAHPRPRRVLIVGGGDGGALRHVLLHPTVERAVEVEIDRRVVDVSLEYLPEISGGAYDDPRAELRITNGVDYMRQSDDRFDVVLIDSTDPRGPAEGLISAPFVETVRDRLAPGGLVAMQSGSPLTQPRECLATVSALRRVFPIVRLYVGFVPIYPGILWSWTIGSAEVDPSRTDEGSVTARIGGLAETLRVYNPALHRAAFALPAFLARLLDDTVEDHSPTRADLCRAGHPLPGVVHQ